MTKILRSLYIEKEQVESLIKLSKRTRVPQAVLVREGVDIMSTLLSGNLSKTDLFDVVSKTCLKADNCRLIIKAIIAIGIGFKINFLKFPPYFC